MSSGSIVWLRPDDTPELFPRPESALAEPNGLLAAGGDLSEARLLAAYRNGIFPWYDAGQPILWWSPDPRCVLRPAGLNVSRRLQQYARRSRLTVAYDTAFGPVIRACAEKRGHDHGTWITPEMIAAFEHLHERGWAHSIEVRDGSELVGGLYGMAIGRVFFGESMFSRTNNASKFAMLGLAGTMLATGLELLDCQVVSPHLLSMGAVEMARDRFTALLAELCDPPLPVSGWPEGETPVPAALDAWLAALQ
ncbi:MAG: leucyl/phenylalanyl-tRNA--protein transferase [Woeseiaceae bacterium]|nr:leucyl/phenylalanyl-tRNA--protein transferase [Woeseiaceae bacterium]